MAEHDEQDAGTGPTPPEERIESIDVLRGVAILGILLVNIFAFGLPEVARFNPTVYGDFSGLDALAWGAVHLFAEGTFLTLFSGLFGVGIVMFMANRRREGVSGSRFHGRRMFWLLVIGLIHAYVFWTGDILVPYALCGLLVVWAWDWRPMTQALLGVAMLSVPVLNELSVALVESADVIADTWEPTVASIEAELETLRGPLGEQLEMRISDSFAEQTTGFIVYSLWRLGGVMLLGMAAYQTGFARNQWSRRQYLRTAAIAGSVGYAVILAGVSYMELVDWGVAHALPFRQFNYVGSILVGLAYAAAVMALAKTAVLTRVRSILARVGRTAFSNYLFQTLVATTIFYGHGLGLIGEFHYAGLLLFVVAIWAIEIVLTLLWLRRYRYGPVEYLWRVLTYGTRPPLRKDSSD